MFRVTDDGAVGAILCDDGDNREYPETSVGIAPVDEWMHVAMVVDLNGPTDVTFYTNAVPAGTAAVTMTTLYTSANAQLTVGDYGPGNTTAAYDGELDEVIVFSRALTSNEVASLYTDGISGDKGESD